MSDQLPDLEPRVSNVPVPSVVFRNSQLDFKETPVERETPVYNKLKSEAQVSCNIKGHVPAFKTDSREVPFSERIKIGGKDCYEPINPNLLHVPLGENARTLGLARTTKGSPEAHP